MASVSSRAVLVVGSINADVFIDIDRLPKAGETMSTSRPDSGHVMPGGKGANQAVAVAKSLHPDSNISTQWVGRFGDDSHTNMLRDVLKSNHVHDDFSGTANVPTGQAFILLQTNGENSIILVAGANHSWPAHPEQSISSALPSAAAVMLQREIPQAVNLAVARAARAAEVPVFLDMGGEDSPVPDELLAQLTYLTANETELARLTHLPTESEEQVKAAADLLQKRVPGLHVLVTLGSRGSLLVLPDGSSITQPAASVSKVVDTTGAGDCFRGAFVAAFLEHNAKEKDSLQKCLKFASAAAALCIQVKGAMPSMPLRAAIEQKLKSV